MSAPRRPPAPRRVDVAVIGAGHSGLSMSCCLAELGIDHVVFERGDPGNAWRHDRWDSMTLLTPNWQCRLPGRAYEGPDPDGFMRSGEVAGFIADYARNIGAPVRNRTRVVALHAEAGGYRVSTDHGEWRAKGVVLANGGFSEPVVPAAAQALPPSLEQFTTLEYKSPAQLPPGGVLVIGASATGLQLAAEIRRAGRAVMLAVGEHVRMPRTYRGRDIQYWLERTGLLDERYDEVDDLTRARNVPSPQLVGTPERATLDLNALSGAGVQLFGRLAGVRDGQALFSGSLRNVCALADLKMNRLLGTIDDWIDASDAPEASQAAERFAPTKVPEPPCLRVDLATGRIGAIVWATGLCPDYSWIRVPVLDRKGFLRHDGGVVDAPGLYVLGLTFLRRRKSSFIHGAEDDCRDLAAHLGDYLRAGRPARHLN